ncbi:MAG TPA: hypothetical protein VI815_01875 [Candidatus Nanoarchaeia archaeon]|nr:hypothetical protein [Candidatus Nanoarchaeia archaeon]
MVDKEKTLKELNEEFHKLKSKIGFKAEFEDLDKAFSIKNHVLKEGYVSDNFSAQLRGRIIEYFNSGASYLHGLLLPNTQNIVNMNESKLFDQENKKIIGQVVGKCMYLSSKNTLINIEGKKDEEGKFIDEAFSFYKKEFNPEMVKVMLKVKDYWSK